eukprot:1161221-Pelagomonas_calceolata.AAC.9
MTTFGKAGHVHLADVKQNRSNGYVRESDEGEHKSDEGVREGDEGVRESGPCGPDRAKLNRSDEGARESDEVVRRQAMWS